MHNESMKKEGVMNDLIYLKRNLRSIPEFTILALYNSFDRMQFVLQTCYYLKVYNNIKCGIVKDMDDIL